MYHNDIFVASSGQVVVSSPGGVKVEKSQPGYSVRSVESKPSTSGVRLVSPSTSKDVQVVRVLNSGSSSTQRVIQVQRKPAAPRILNQSLGRQEVKEEPMTDSPVTVVRKVVSESEESPPTKKTKYITLTTSQINQIEGATIMGGGKSKRIVMLPSNYREQLEKISTRPTVQASGSTTFKIVQESNSSADPLANSSGTFNKSKRPCNCTKSQCLKFYCDCFAAGEFCSGCNCKDCLNTDDSEERERAVKMCMERNPFAFK